MYTHWHVGMIVIFDFWRDFKQTLNNLWSFLDWFWYLNKLYRIESMLSIAFIFRYNRFCTMYSIEKFVIFSIALPPSITYTYECLKAFAMFSFVSYSTGFFHMFAEITILWTTVKKDAKNFTSLYIVFIENCHQFLQWFQSNKFFLTIETIRGSFYSNISDNLCQ